MKAGWAKSREHMSKQLSYMVPASAPGWIHALTPSMVDCDMEVQAK